MAHNTVAVDTQTWDEQVVHADQPVLVDFWASWCAPCRMIAPALEELAGELAGRVKVAKLDVDDNAELSARYGIRSIPTLLLFRGGQVVGHRIGAMPKQAIAEFVDASLGTEQRTLAR